MKASPNRFAGRIQCRVKNSSSNGPQDFTSESFVPEISRSGPRISSAFSQIFVGDMREIASSLQHVLFPKRRGSRTHWHDLIGWGKAARKPLLLDFRRFFYQALPGPRVGLGFANRGCGPNIKFNGDGLLAKLFALLQFAALGIFFPRERLDHGQSC